MSKNRDLFTYSANYDEMVLTRGDFRVRIVQDATDRAPDYDGASPILQLEGSRWGTSNVEQVIHTTDWVTPDNIDVAAKRWAAELDTFERYLRIFYGVTDFQQYGTDGATYVTFDPAAWRAYCEIAQTGPGTADMSEWIAYLEGDVFGIIVERKVVETTTISTTSGGVVRTDTNEAWSEVESVWNFYGDTDYLYDTAVEMLSDLAEQ